MKATQIRELSGDEIATRIKDLERERFNLGFRSGTQPLDDPLRLRVIRRELARLKTVQRQMAGASAAAAPARTGGK
jgi:large subunit ribosomal protein L29